MSGGVFFFFFQAEDGIRDVAVTGVQTCALPIYEEWGDPARSFLEQGAGVLLERLESAGPGPHDGADTLQVDLVPVVPEARVRHRLLRRAERELREQVVAADLLLVEEPRRLEPLHLARELHRALHRVEPRDRAGTRATRDQALPGAVHVGTQRRHEPKARDRC